MQHRFMRGVDRPLPVLGLGAMRLPLGPDGRIDRAAATALIRHAVDHGVTYLDTAWVYHNGESEPFLGEALGNGYRERVQLATKLPVWAARDRADMDRILDLQRERLRTDVIDFYLLHGLNRTGWERALGLGVLEFLDDALADGRILHASFSFHDDFDTFRSIVDAYDWTFAQVQYNYVDVHVQGGIEAVRYASERGLGVVVMEPLRGGTLARPVPGAAELWARAGVGRTPADWALSWLWDQPEVTVVLSGMNTFDQLRANIACAGRLEGLDQEGGVGEVRTGFGSIAGPAVVHVRPLLALGFRPLGAAKKCLGVANGLVVSSTAIGRLEADQRHASLVAWDEGSRGVDSAALLHVLLQIGHPFRHHRIVNAASVAQQSKDGQRRRADSHLGAPRPVGQLLRCQVLDAAIDGGLVELRIGAGLCGRLGTCDADAACQPDCQHQPESADHRKADGEAEHDERRRRGAFHIDPFRGEILTRATENRMPWLSRQQTSCRSGRSLGLRSRLPGRGWPNKILSPKLPSLIR